MAPVASILNQFSQTRMHFKDVNLLFPTIYNLWGSMIIYLWIAKNNDQICDSGVYLQNDLVEYIGVYSDINNYNVGIIYSHTVWTDVEQYIRYPDGIVINVRSLSIYGMTHLANSYQYLRKITTDSFNISNVCHFVEQLGLYSTDNIYSMRDNGNVKAGLHLII